MITARAALLIPALHLAGKPQNEVAQMIGHAFVDNMLPMTAQFFGDGGLLGTAQPHDVIASS